MDWLWFIAVLLAFAWGLATGFLGGMEEANRAIERQERRQE